MKTGNREAKRESAGPLNQDESILTDRLTLRCLVQRDAHWIAREIANPNVHRWLTTPPKPYRLDDAKDFIAEFKNDSAYRVICEGETPLGVISLDTRDDGARELGYWLRQDAWGRGLMSEAARAMVDWHWAQSTNPIKSGWIVGNARSAQILTQLGFRSIGQAENHVQFLGEPRVLERVQLDAPHRPLFTLRTERLVLNATTLEDVPVIQHAFGRPEVARMMATVKPNWTYDEARSWLLLRLVPNERGFSRAVRLHDGRLIGSIGVGGNPYNLGYMFDPDHWGRGYASEALQAFLPAAFAHFPEIDQIGADIYDDNPASARILQKLGFVRVGAANCEGIGRVEAAPSSAYRVTRAELKA